MKNTDFMAAVKHQVEHCLNLLAGKGKEYAGENADRLVAFKKAAALQGVSEAQAAFGMLAKHLVSVADMVEHPEAYTREKWDERLGDSINYLLIIRAIAEEAKCSQPMT